MKLKTQYRSYSLVKDSLDHESRAVEVAFSSTEPYERFFGVEVLDHATTSVRLGRLNDGGAVLVNHNTDQHIGVVERAWLDGDNKGRAVVRLGRSSLAEQALKDIEDGILRHVSVGYRVHEMLLEKSGKAGTLDQYRVTDWEPYEISLVAIPADPTVGVGRAAEEPEQTVIIKNLEFTEPKKEIIPMSIITPPVDSEAIERDATKTERQRVQEILAIGQRHQLADLAREYVEQGSSLDAFRQEVLKRLESKPLEAKPSPEIGLSKKETGAYSLLRAIQAQASGDWSKAGLELEASRAIAQKMGTPAKGFYVPYEWMSRDLLVGTNTAGGHLVSTDLLSGSFIELLRNRMMVSSLGAKMLTGLVGDVAIPRQTGGATAYWVSENSALTESQQAFDRVTLTPKTVGAYTEMSRKLLQQSSVDIENLVKSDLATCLALAIDLAAINGSGSSGQPTGILGTSGIGAVAGGTNGAAPTWAHVVGLETEVSVDNALLGNLAYLTNASVRGKLKQTEAFSSTGQRIWSEGGTVNGYRAEVSQQVPSNLTKGTASGTCSAIIFGNWGDLLIGQWGTLDIQVNPFSLDTTGAVRITAFQDMDVAVRHASSFAAMVDALTA